MIHTMRRRTGRAALLGLLATIAGCVGGGFGVVDEGWGDDGYDEAPLGYDMGFFGGDAYDYGGWGSGYLIGPPAYGGYGYGYGHRGGWGHPHGPDHGGGGVGNRGGRSGMYRPAPAGHPMPSIPSGGRGGGMRGGRR